MTAVAICILLVVALSAMYAMSEVRRLWRHKKEMDAIERSIADAREVRAAYNGVPRERPE